MGKRLTGTKEVIFDEAIRLISQVGYETVNMRQIAKSTGIKAASIYNHFSSKQEILEAIYSFYETHFTDSIKTDDELKKVIDSGSGREILNAIMVSFDDGDIKKFERMVLISKIIYMRFFNDSRAADIFFNLMTSQMEAYMTRLLDYGVASGRLRPFDTKTFASITVSSVHIMGVKAFSRPDYTVAELEEQENIREMLAAILPINE